MIDVTKLRFKNVLSFGNGWTEVDFQNGHIYLVVGENGHGKSAIYEALFFSLYGKPFRKVKKDELINVTNRKELETEIFFRSNGKDFRIRRGIKPGIFEIWVDGKLRNQDAAARDYQEYLERNVLKMDEKTFRQKVVLGSSSFVPFMKLSAGERRTVVEDVLGVSIYSVMLKVAKEKVAKLRDEYTGIKTEVDKDKIRHSMKTEEMEKSRLGVKEELARIDLDILQLEQEAEKISTQASEIEPHIAKDDVEKLFNDGQVQFLNVTEKASTLQIHINTSKRDIRFFTDNTVCPTCSRPITEDFRKEKINEAESTISGYENKLETAQKEHDRIRAENSEYRKKLEEISENVARLRECTVSIAEKMKSIASLRAYKEEVKHRKGSNADEIKKQVTELEASIRARQCELKRIGQEGVDYAEMVELLKDGGIKNKIVKDYLPVINRLISRYLQILEFPVTFTFDENFEESIKARHRDGFSYGAFSEGEKMRLDLALLFTWREVTRLRSSSHCNLIILDEIGDSSLDENGLEAFMKILNNERDKQCAIIISHKPHGFSSRVNRTMTVKRPGLFSEVSVNHHKPENILL